MNKLSALKKNKKRDTYDYAIFHILKYHETNNLKKNKIYHIIISHLHKSSIKHPSPLNLSIAIIR